MQNRRFFAIAFLSGCVFFCVVAQHAAAFIQNLFPLQEFIDDSDFIFTATVEKIDPAKPSAVLVVKEHLKGKGPFTRIPINLTGDISVRNDDDLRRLEGMVETAVVRALGRGASIQGLRVS